MENEISLEKGQYYDPQNNRIIYIRHNSTPDMWHYRWHLDDKSLTKYLTKHNINIVKLTYRFLKPQDGTILEGGCGYGGKVNSLMQAGYQVIGVDFDNKTVSFLNKNDMI